MNLTEQEEREALWRYFSCRTSISVSIPFSVGFSLSPAKAAYMVVILGTIPPSVVICSSPTNFGIDTLRWVYVSLGAERTLTTQKMTKNAFGSGFFV
jgi:hypothetical protein